MTPTIYNVNNLPEYLLGDNLHEDLDQLWLVRLHAPRFVGRIDEHPDGTITITQIEWIDPQDASNPSALARLLREAGDWVAEELIIQQTTEE